MGFAPYESPRYAVSVVVEHGGGGSKAAAPIARDALHEIQKRDRAALASLRDGAAARPEGEDAI